MVNCLKLQAKNGYPYRYMFNLGVAAYKETLIIKASAGDANAGTVDANDSTCEIDLMAIRMMNATVYMSLPSLKQGFAKALNESDITKNNGKDVKMSFDAVRFGNDLANIILERGGVPYEGAADAKEARIHCCYFCRTVKQCYELFAEYYPELAGNTNNDVILRGFSGGLDGKQTEKLFKLLINGGYIDKGTLLKDFKGVFEGGNLADGFQAIEWTKRKSLLAWFIFALFGKSNRDYFRKAERCFKDGKNLKQLKNEYEGTKDSEPKGADELEEIIKEAGINIGIFQH
jgi:hypothetical protein